MNALKIDGEDSIAKAGLVVTENLSTYLGTNHSRFEISHKLASVFKFSGNFDGAPLPILMVGLINTELLWLLRLMI